MRFNKTQRIILIVAAITIVVGYRIPYLYDLANYTLLAMCIIPWLWVWYLAAQNKIWKGMLCFFFPVLAVIYAIRHWSDVPARNTRRPSLMFILSLATAVFSVAISRY